jgi:hypothetical protein
VELANSLKFFWQESGADINVVDFTEISIVLALKLTAKIKTLNYYKTNITV